MSEATPTFAARLPRFSRSEALIGASSPLWGYFAGAALLGTALWWASRWGDLAAGRLETAPKASGAVEPAALAREPAPAAPSIPTGGESAPISPLTIADAAPPEPATAAAVEAPLVPAAAKRKAKDEPKPH